jgi:hypothetical protein
MIMHATVPQPFRTLAAILALTFAMAALPADPAAGRGLQVSTFTTVTEGFNPCTGETNELTLHIIQRLADRVTPTGRETRLAVVQATWSTDDGMSGRSHQTTTEMYPDPNQPSSVINHTLFFHGLDAQGRVVHYWARIIVRETPEGWDVKLEDIGARCAGR